MQDPLQECRLSPPKDTVKPDIRSLPKPVSTEDHIRAINSDHLTALWNKY